MVRYDRGNRGRDSFSDRDRERERERPRERGVGRGSVAEPIRNNRMPERDHRDRYANDSRTGKGREDLQDDRCCCGRMLIIFCGFFLFW